jgi:predicted restriction endonuclease
MNTRFVDGHHIQHWADGGETSLGNLVTLCRHHHHLVHEGGFVCEMTGDGAVRFKDQRQRIIESISAMPGVVANDDVQQWFDREFFETNIDSETCKAKWLAGERMDWQAAVQNLFY